ERAGDRGHAAGEAGGALGAFQRADLLLEHRDGGVGVAAVDVPGRLAQRDVAPLVEVVVTEGDAVHHGHLGSALEQVGVLAGPHRGGALAGGRGAGALAGVRGAGALVALRVVVRSAHFVLLGADSTVIGLGSTVA